MKTDYLPLADYERIFALMSDENALPLRIALETGLRIDDVLSLKRSQIDLKNRKISYVASKTKKRGTAHFSDELAERLKNLPQKGYIFPSRSSTGHRTRQAVYIALKKACADLGVSGNISPHSTRKTFAVEELKTHTLSEVQAELQHSNPLVTMVYAYSDKKTYKTEENEEKNTVFVIKRAILELFQEAFTPLINKYCT